MSDIFLKSGRVIYAFDGVVGIDGCGNAFTGYDQQFGDFEDALTPEEAIELADMMIERWTDFREAMQSKLTINRA